MSFESVKIGNATLYCGDCLEILPTLGKVDAVVTDPPYGVGLTCRTTKHTKRQSSKNYQDDGQFIIDQIIPRVIAATGIAPVAAISSGIRWIQAYPKPADIGTVFFPNGAGSSPWGFNCNNPILFYGTCPYLKRGMGSRPNSVSATHWFSDDVDHPCPKPVPFMKWMVMRTSPAMGETILDPFMGSGTTGVACAELGRHFIGIEIDRKYFDIACERITKAYAQGDLFIDKPKPIQEDLL